MYGDAYGYARATFCRYKCYMKRVLLLTVALLACTPDPHAPHPITDTDKCGDAEKHLIELGCLDNRGRLLGGPNLHGQSFKQRCEIGHQAKLWFNPVCRTLGG